MATLNTIEAPPVLLGGWPTDEAHTTHHVAIILHPEQTAEVSYDLPVTTNPAHALAVGQGEVEETVAEESVG